MSAAVVALVMILGILMFAATMLLFYELVAVRTGRYPTISAYWSMYHKGRIFLLGIVGVILTVLYIFLMGDLVLEVW